ncbi:MAG TPA: flagellar motor switch protein FliM [Candidatus Hydrogenedentes bacterium]|nr:flagellar motor switch protein FliM [Candidatus Hydrogenedentota bacterium]HOL76525.1 flagellar motor switch protein FliM [Candidatus Hydrogenedentota bacterium]HPO85189.1 flagellar motor switch protein FliM [Candidatus Hydrogenedentota bacterium]
MADILSQEEVDLLLSAVSKGEIETEQQTPYEPVQAQDVAAYDFRRPERVSKEQLKGLQSLFEALARELSIALPPFLRTVVRVDLVSIDQLTYDEFILSVSRPTSLTVINMAPLEGNAVIELSPLIVFPIVDRILGGKGAMISEPREPTEIENRIIYRIVLMILESLKRSWEQLIEFKMSIVSQESDPLIVQIVAGSDMVILVGYEIHIGNAVGSMNMCIPLIFLNPILDQISQQTRFIRRMTTEVAEQTRARIFKAIRSAIVPLDVILGKARLNVSDLMKLQVGDILQLDTNKDQLLPVEVGGVDRFRARPGRIGERAAVQLVALKRDE